MGRALSPKHARRQRRPALRVCLALLAVSLVAVGVWQVSGVLQERKAAEQAEKRSQQIALKREKYFNDRGHITLDALVEIDGDDLADMMNSAGYREVTRGNAHGWTNSDDSCMLLVSARDRGGYLDEDGLRELAAGGGKRAATYELILAGYGSTSSALDNMGNTTYGKRDDVAINASVATVVSSTDERYLCRACLEDGSKTNVLLLNDAALSAGALAEYGTNVDAAYNSLVDSKRGQAGLATRGTDDKTSVDPPDSLTEACLDEYGNPTVYAISAMPGAELVQMLQSQGYAFDLEQGSFVSVDTLDKFSVLNADAQPLSAEGISGLGVGEGTVVYEFQTSKYRGPHDVLDGMVKCTVADRKTVDHHSMYAVARGASDREFLLFVSNPTDKGTFVVRAFTNEAVAAGLAQRFAAGEPGAPNVVGSSVSEVWQNLVGVPIGEYMRQHPDE